MADPATSPSALRAWLAILPGLLLALYLRLPELGRKPMHTDEAVQAGTTGRLLDDGFFAYHYDPVEYHGPTLYYFTLPLAHLRGQHAFRQLDETTLRLVPALFGVGLLLWLPLFRGVLGVPGIAFSALLLAASPVFTYYSRYYIQEMLLVFFTLGLAASLARLHAGGGLRWAVVAGLSAGMMHATKETCVLTFGAMAGAGVAAAWAGRPFRLPANWKRGVIYFVAAAALLSSVFLSSFLANPRGPLDAILTFFHYAGKAVENGHEKPWWWYARMLAWHRESAGPVFHELGLLVPGLGGLALLLARGWRRTSSAGGLFSALWFILLAGVYSLIRYKTPWLVVNPLLPLALMAGMLADAVMRGRRPVRFAGAALLMALCVQQGVRVTGRVTGRYASDERNPYAYTHPTRDIVDGCRTLVRLAEQSARPVTVHVLADEYWPIPWYLRSLDRVGYWDSAQPAGDADVWILNDAAEAAWESGARPPVHDRVHGLRPGLLLHFKYKEQVWSDFHP